MKKTSGAEPDTLELVTILNIDPIEADHASLEDIFGRSEWNPGPNSEWNLTSSPTPETAFEVMRQHRIPVLFCEGDVHPGRWQRVLDDLLSLPDPPCLIVTSRLADDRLWAEALNLGAYDVLAKPFDRTEVTRIVRSAWLHWKNRREPASKRMACVA